MNPRLVVGVSLCLFFVGCGGSSGSSPTPVAVPTPAQRSVLVATVEPNPVIWVAAGTRCATQPDLALWTTTIKETAGLSGNVNFINVTARSKTTGLEFNTINYSASDVTSRASTNHINASGQISLSIGICSTLSATQGRQQTITQVVNFTDDRGNVINVQTVFDVL